MSAPAHQSDISYFFLAVIIVVVFSNKTAFLRYDGHQSYLYLTTLWLLGVCETQWVTSPNVAVLAGSTSTFTCYTGNRSATCFTYRKDILDNDIVDICVEGFDDKFIDRCNVTMQSTEGTVTLTVGDVQLSDVGLYSCGDCFNPAIMARLLVLGKKLANALLMTMT